MKKVTYHCSACGKNLTGYLAAGFVVDRCPACGVVLPKHQIEEFMPVARAQLLGIAIGLTVASLFSSMLLAVPFIWLAWAYFRYRPNLRHWRNLPSFIQNSIQNGIEIKSQVPISKSVRFWKTLGVFICVYFVSCISLVVIIVPLSDIVKVGGLTFGLIILGLPAILSLYLARCYFRKQVVSK
jgi:hypothetical protein